ncbi:MAG: TIGR03663 family protein [Planctomycetes bacterium]|nr:TIGR03663 family protein [Planctomycetota bacterium]
MKRTLFVSAIIITAAAASALRLSRLSLRPMHTDEAVHAVKFADLLENNQYRYDPYEYHGPTLYYFTLPVAWLSGCDNFTDITETTIRLIPALFGIATILLFLLIADAIGYPAAFIGALLTAGSPAMVFYSRYYIHETLLVFFSFLTIAAVWRYLCSRSLGWLILAGVAIALMHATKETCIISFAALTVALLIVNKQKTLHQKNTGVAKPPPSINNKHFTVAYIIMAAVSFIFFSSFFTNFRGPIDSFLTYATYFNRAGADNIHQHPWYYYLKMLIFTKYAPGPFWTEALILILAAIGSAAILLNKKISNANKWFLRFIAIYTFILILVYSLIPYKTPWCMLTFLHGLIILAGAGAVYLIQIIPVTFGRMVVSLILIAAACHLIQQTTRTNFRFFADSRNPYVYAHTVTDTVRLSTCFAELADIHPNQNEMPIQIIAEPDNYWPFPWYLRQFTHVGYWPNIPDQIYAPVIITSQSTQPLVEKKLTADYHQESYGLRPSVKVQVFIKKDLWDSYLNSKRTIE